MSIQHMNRQQQIQHERKKETDKGKEGTKRAEKESKNVMR